MRNYSLLFHLGTHELNSSIICSKSLLNLFQNKISSNFLLVKFKKLYFLFLRYAKDTLVSKYAVYPQKRDLAFWLTQMARTLKSKGWKIRSNNTFWWLCSFIVTLKRLQNFYTISYVQCANLRSSLFKIDFKVVVM